MNTTGLVTRRRFAGTLTLLAAALAAPTARARPEYGTAAMEHRIARILAEWDGIAEHRTGTAGDRATANWLVRELAGAGVSAQLDCFPFRRRSVGEAWVEVDGQRIEGLPCFDGGATEGTLEAALGAIDGSGGIGVGAFSPASPDAETRALVAARKARTHRALIAVSAGRDMAPGLAVANAEDFLHPSPLPVLQVATEHRDRLEQALRAGRRARLRIHFDETDTDACNVQALVPGRATALAPVVVMTPRSSWWASTAERGGGIVVWLEAARMLAARPPLRTVIFTANTGHELGHVGLDAWLARNPELVGSAHAWVHLGANFAARDGAIRLQASSADLLELGRAALEAESVAPGQTTPVGTRPLGEARNVFDGGGRYVSLLGSNPLFHHPADRWPQAVDLPKTIAATRAMLTVVERLANTAD